MTTLENKLLAHRFYNEVINQRNLDLLDQLAHENFVDHNPDPGTEGTRAGVKAAFHGFLEAFPTMTMTVEHTVAEGDLVGCRCVMRGTHLGTLNGIAATGREIEVRGFDWLRIKDGLVVERWGNFYTLSMMQQLGALPGPSVEDLKGLSKKYFETIDATKGDISGLVGELVAPTLKIHFGSQPHALNFTEAQGLMKSFWVAFPDTQHELKAQICEGDQVFNHLRVTGTHRGTFAGVPATNTPIAVEAMVSHTWTDGLLAEVWLNVDLASILTQLGAVK